MNTLQCGTLQHPLSSPHLGFLLLIPQTNTEEALLDHEGQSLSSAPIL